MNERWTAAAIAVLAAAIFFFHLQSEGDSEKRDAAQSRVIGRVFVSVCSRNNVFKAISRNDEKQRVALSGAIVKLIKVAQPKLAPEGAARLRGEAKAIRMSAEAGVTRKTKLMPILNCNATFANGTKRGVPLTREQAARFLHVVRRAEIPLMSPSGDRVIGGRPAETGTLADF